MRLFSRRKEVQFDDPRLVGMAPLKTIEERALANDSIAFGGGGGVDNGEEDDKSSSSSSSSSPINARGREREGVDGNYRRGGGGSSSVSTSTSTPTTPTKTPAHVLMFLPTLQQEEEEEMSRKWLSQSSACLLTTQKNQGQTGLSSGGVGGEGGGREEAKMKSMKQQENKPGQLSRGDEVKLRDHKNRMNSSQGSNGNGIGSLSTWSRRVSVTWDSMRRAESSEALTSGVLSSTLNRRKTLHFYPDLDYSNHSSASSKLSEKVMAAKEKFNTLRHASSTSKIAQTQTKSNKDTLKKKNSEDNSNNSNQSQPSGKKLGRVESLRILLTKSNRLRGKGGNSTKGSPNVKVDKGTDTEDLTPSSPFRGEYSAEESMMTLEDESLTSISRQIYSSTSQLSSLGSSSGYYDDSGSCVTGVSNNNGTMRRASLCADLSSIGARDQFLMMKTTSCENLASMTLNRNSNSQGRYFQLNSSSQPETSSKSKTTSTGTMTNDNCSNYSKRSSFPYAYIRSKLTALPEEPNHHNNTIIAPSTITSSVSFSKETKGGSGSGQGSALSTRNGKPRRSLSQRGFFHSMGDLLTRSSTNLLKDSSDVDEMSVDESSHVSRSSILRPKRRSSIAAPRPNSIACPPGKRMFDPLTQIRIDLLHKNPPPDEFDDDQLEPSPGLNWNRRSYSIGDILTESRKSESMSNGNQRFASLTGSSTNVEEVSSGYDSDSTRTGHESPRSSIKISSETEEIDVELRREKLPSLLTDHPSLSEFDVESTLGSAVDSSTSAPSPTSSSSSTSSAYSSDEKSYGPLAYVTLKRKGETLKSHRQSSNSSSSATSRTLPRSQSISCGGGSNNSSIPKRKASVDLPRNGVAHFVSRTEVVPPTKHNNTSDEKTTLIDYKSDGTTTVTTTTTAAPSLRLRNKVRDRDVNWHASRAQRSQSLCLSIFSVRFEKGPTKKSLGFSVVGGKDSPKGSMGIFIKRIFPYGQASEEGNITEGDEILSVNGHSLSDSTHTEALNIFKGIKTGEVVLQIARREMVKPTATQEVSSPARPTSSPGSSYLRSKSMSCEQLSERKI